MEKARCNTELYSNLRAPLNNVKPSNFWGSHQNDDETFISLYNSGLIDIDEYEQQLYDLNNEIEEIEDEIDELNYELEEIREEIEEDIEDEEWERDMREY